MLVIPHDLFLLMSRAWVARVLSYNMLDRLEYRHDWASLNFTIVVFKHFLLGFIPKMLIHSRSQGKLLPAKATRSDSCIYIANSADEEQVRDHYDRGDDFYAWFLEPRMIYTSGIISDITREETLEEIQDNKLEVVCEKITCRAESVCLILGVVGDPHQVCLCQLRRSTGITLSRNQTKWGNNGLCKAGIHAQRNSPAFCAWITIIPPSHPGSTIRSPV